MKNLFINLFVYIFLSTFALTCFWLVYPYNPITFKDNIFPIQNENKQVKSGGYLDVKIDFCKDNDLTPTVSETFIDGIIYSVPTRTVSVKSKGCNVIFLKVYVPKALPLGKYYLQNTYRYQVNPLRHIDVSKTTEQFEIIK